MNTPIIDAHQHIWDPARARYDWLGPEFHPIDRALSFDDVRDDLAACGVTHTVQVQSADNSEDTDLMVESAQQNPQVVGIVGYAPLDRPEDVAETIAGWTSDPLMVGVRTLIHNLPDPDYLLRSDVSESLELLAHAGLTFDVVAVLPRHLEIIPELAQRHPELKLVIDHLAKPPIGALEESGWWDAIVRASEHPTVYAKVSGLYSAVGDLGDWTTESIRPAFDHAVQAFSPQRLMYGGDWPISVLAGGYQRVWNGLLPLFESLDVGDRQRILAGTAIEFYGIDPARVGL